MNGLRLFSPLRFKRLAPISSQDNFNGLVAAHLNEMALSFGLILDKMIRRLRHLLRERKHPSGGLHDRTGHYLVHGW